MNAPLPISTLIGLLGCAPPREAPAPVGQDHDTDPLGDETGMTQDMPVFSSVEVSLSEAIPAVAVVTFRVEGDVGAGTDEGWVRFGPAGEEGWVVAADLREDGSWRAVLVGVPPERDAWLQVGMGSAQDAVVYDYRTGAGPDWLTVTAEGAPETAGFLLTAVMGPQGQSGAVILNAEGAPVWWYPAPVEAGVGGILSRAMLSADGRSLWFNAFTIEPKSAQRDAGCLVKVALDGSSFEVLDAYPKSHHDFFVRPDGLLVLPVLDDREYQGAVVRGDSLVEVDLVAGTETVVWSSWDGLTPSTTGMPEGWWTMLNHIAWDEAQDDYLLSLKNISAVVRVDRATGALEWVLGGGGDATLQAADLPRGQHGLDVAEDGDILVFDNQGSGNFSRILRYAIDPVAQQAEVEWGYKGEVTSLIMGDMAELPGGNVLVSWSSARHIEEIRLDGVVVSHLEVPEAINVGYVSWLSRIGPPPVSR